MFQVFDNNRPADSTSCSIKKGIGWDNSKFETFEAACAYACDYTDRWLGFPNQNLFKLNENYIYSGAGDFVVIKEIKELVNHSGEDNFLVIKEMIKEIKDNQEKNFRDQMKEIFVQIDKLIKLGTNHCDICNKIADQFHLWENDKFFPIWLSRIIEGRINNFENNEEGNGI